MQRSDAETAMGGLLLGMSLPTLLFGALLVCDLSAALGMLQGSVAIVFGALIVVGAVMQGLSGATLLWAHRALRQRPAQVKAGAPGVSRPPAQRRHAPPRVRARSRHATPMGVPPKLRKPVAAARAGR